MPLEFPNLFDLEKRKPGPRSCVACDCNRLGRVVSQFVVHCLLLTDQQIGFTVLAFYPNWQALTNTVSCALSVLWTARILGDVAGHIKHFTPNDDFLPLHEWRASALRQIKPNRGYACQNNYRYCKAQYLRP